MPNMDSPLEVERRRQLGDVIGIGVHIIALPSLGRSTVTAAIVRDHPISLGEEEQ
jgi:hypothetical protein